jgi:hypothetical protein
MNHCNQYCNLQALFGLYTSMLDCVLPTIPLAVRILKIKCWNSLKSKTPLQRKYNKYQINIQFLLFWHFVKYNKIAHLNIEASYKTFIAITVICTTHFVQLHKNRHQAYPLSNVKLSLLHGYHNKLNLNGYWATKLYHELFLYIKGLDGYFCHFASLPGCWNWQLGRISLPANFLFSCCSHCICFFPLC